MHEETDACNVHHVHHYSSLPTLLNVAHHSFPCSSTQTGTVTDRDTRTQTYFKSAQGCSPPLKVLRHSALSSNAQRCTCTDIKIQNEIIPELSAHQVFPSSLNVFGYSSLPSSSRRNTATDANAHMQTQSLILPELCSARIFPRRLSILCPSPHRSLKLRRVLKDTLCCENTLSSALPMLAHRHILLSTSFFQHRRRAAGVHPQPAPC